MAKFSVAYVKQHPVMFGAIFVVFGLVLWMLLNRSGSGGGSYVVQGGGPSDAQVAAGTQAQMAQLAANRDISLAQLSLQGQAMQIDGQREIAAAELALRVQELGAQHDLGVKTIESSLMALNLQLNAQRDMSADNNAFMIAYARQASDAATNQLLISSALQRDLSAQQADAYKFTSLISAASMMKKKRRSAYLNNIVNTLGDSNTGQTTNSWSQLLGGQTLQLPATNTNTSPTPATNTGIVPPNIVGATA